MHTLLKRLSLLIVVVTVGLILISCWDDTGSNSTETTNNAPKWTKSEYSDSCERNDTLIIDLLSLAVDPDDDSIIISIINTGSVFGTLNNGFYTIVAPNDTTSGFSADIIASDGSLSDTSTLNIKFYGDIKINNAPKWSDTSYAYNAIIGESLIIDLSKLSSDVDSNDILTYSILESSDIDSIIDTNYVITPMNDSLTSYTVELIVTDGIKSDTAKFVISIMSGNSAPEWNDTIFNYTITKGELFNLDLSKISADADSDKVSYSILDNSSGLDTIIDSIYSITADSASVSPFTVLLIVSDGKESDTSKFIFTLKEANKKPVFTSDKPKVLYEIEEGDSIEVMVEASDPDSSGTVVLGIDTLGTLPNPNTASFTAGVFKWKSTLGESGSYVITFFATDGEDTARTDVTIKVGEANIIPTITVPDSISNGSARVAEGSTLTIDFTFDDLDVSDSLTINSKIPSIEGLSFITKGDSAATLTYTPNYETVINDSVKIIDSITISVTDGEDEVDFVLIITVANTNRKPVFTDNSPADLYTVTSGDTLEIPFSATDADSEDNVVITVDTTTFKTGADITVSGNKIIWNTVFGDIGTDSITLSASDGEDVTNKTIAVIVNENTTTPTITVSAAGDTLEITEVDSTGFIVSAVPVVQGDIITLGCSSSLPDSVISFNVSSGKFSFKANYDMATLTNPDTVFAVKFTAIGSGANASMAEYTQFIKVKNVNRVPVITIAPTNDSLMIHTKYIGSFEVQDFDGDNLTYDFSISPDIGLNLTYNNSTQKITCFFDRLNISPGDEFDVVVSISDGSETSIDTTWKLKILNREWSFQSYLEDDIIAVYPRDSINLVKLSKSDAWSSTDAGKTFDATPFYTVPTGSAPVYYNIVNIGNVHIKNNKLAIIRNTYSPGMPNTAFTYFDYLEDGTISRDTTYWPHWIMAYDYFMNDNGDTYACGPKSSHGGMVFKNNALDSITTVGSLREVASSKNGDYIFYANDSNIVRNNVVLSSYENIMNYENELMTKDAKLYMKGSGDTIYVIDSSNNKFLWSTNATASKSLVDFNEISSSPSITAIGIKKIVLNSSKDGWLLDSSGKIYYSNNCFQTLYHESTIDESENTIIINNIYPTSDNESCFAVGTSINGKAIIRY